MRIASVALKHPSLKVANDSILEMLDTCSNGVNPRILSKYKRLVTSLLNKTGSVTRYIRDSKLGERASTLVNEAMLDAIQQANLRPDDIDLLIYGGVGKGFLEPANAYFYAAGDDETIEEEDAACLG